MQLHDFRHHPVIKFFLYIVFFVVIIAFVFAYGWNAASSNRANAEANFARYQSSDPLAFLPWRKWEYISVNEVRASREQVAQRKFRILPQQLMQFLAQQGQMPQWATDEEAVQLAMDNRILRAEGRRLGIVVSRDEIIGELKQQYGSNPAMLDQAAMQKGMTVDQFIDYLTEEAAAARVKGFIANQARASLFELWQEFLLAKEKITLKVAAYPVEHYVSNVQVSETDLQEYLDKNVEAYRVPTKRRYAYAKVTKEELRQTVAPTPEDVKAHYEKNQEAFKESDAVKVEEFFIPVSADQPSTAALELANKAYAAAPAATEWNKLADEIQAASPEKSIYYRAQDWIERSDDAKRIYGQSYVESAFTLADNVISSPVLGPTGYHVMRRIERRAEGVPALDTIYAKVESHYKDSKADELFKEKRKTLEAEALKYSAVKDFATGVAIKDELTTQVTVTNLNIPGVGALQEHAAYIRAMKPGKMSELIPIPSQNPDTLCVIEVAEETESYLPKLDEVRAAVEEQVKKLKAGELALAAAEAARKAVEGGAEFDVAVADAPKAAVESKPFTRVESVDALEAPLIGFAQESRGIVRGSVGVSPYGEDQSAPLGYAVWRVKSLAEPTRDEFTEQRRSFEADYLGLMGATLVEEWLADKRKELGYELLYKTPDKS